MRVVRLEGGGFLLNVSLRGDDGPAGTSPPPETTPLHEQPKRPNSCIFVSLVFSL